MKKLLSVLLSLMMISALVACGDSTGDNVAGTWEVSGVEYEGTKFTVAEWKEVEDEDLSAVGIVFKDGGKAYLYEEDDADLVNWLQSEDEIMIDGDLFTIIDGEICFEKRGEKIYFSKISDSQEIPQGIEE